MRNSRVEHFSLTHMLDTRGSPLSTHITALSVEVSTDLHMPLPSHISIHSALHAMLMHGMPSNTRILAVSGGLLTGSDKGRERLTPDSRPAGTAKLTSVAMDGRGTMFWLWLRPRAKTSSCACGARLSLVVPFRHEKTSPSLLSRDGLV